MKKEEENKKERKECYLIGSGCISSQFSEYGSSVLWLVSCECRAHLIRNITYSTKLTVQVILALLITYLCLNVPQLWLNHQYA